MGFDGVGIIGAVIIGGIAGWLAGKVMNTSTGVLMNIILGIVGTIVASVLLGILGVLFGGWIGYLIVGFIGACILIASGRAVSSKRAKVPSRPALSRVRPHANRAQARQVFVCKTIHSIVYGGTGVNLGG